MSNIKEVIAFMLITYGSLFCGLGLEVTCSKLMGFAKKRIRALYATKRKREFYRSQMKLLRRQKKELQKKNLAFILYYFCIYQYIVPFGSIRNFPTFVHICEWFSSLLLRIFSRSLNPY